MLTGAGHGGARAGTRWRRPGNQAVPDDGSSHPSGAAADRVAGRMLLVAGLAMLVAADVVPAIARTPAAAFAGAAFWGLHMALTQGAARKAGRGCGSARPAGHCFRLLQSGDWRGAPAGKPHRRFTLGRLRRRGHVCRWSVFRRPRGCGSTLLPSDRANAAAPEGRLSMTWPPRVVLAAALPALISCGTMPDTRIPLLARTGLRGRTRLRKNDGGPGPGGLLRPGLGGGRVL